MQSQFALRNNQFPKDLASAVELAANHKWDRNDRSRPRNPNRNGQSNNKQSYNSSRNNSNSKDNNDFSANTSKPAASQSTSSSSETKDSYAQSLAICHICGLPGHTCNNDCCPQKDLPKSQWYITKVQPLAAAHAVAKQHSKSRSADSKTKKSVGWSGLQTDESFQFFEIPIIHDLPHTEAPPCDEPTPDLTTRFCSFLNSFKRKVAAKQDYLQKSLHSFKQQLVSSKSLLYDSILLDSGSGIDGTFCNPELVTDIRPATKPITMQTNAGTHVLNTQATVPAFG
jgi:hypothetical protein